MWIERDGEREIGHRSAFIDCYFVGILVNHADQEVYRVFLSRFGGGRPLGQRRHDKGLMPPAVIPSAGIRYFSVALLPELRILTPAH